MPESGQAPALPIDPVIPVFREWALTKGKVTELTTHMNKLRDRIAVAVAERGYRDHKGSQYIDLPFPLQVGETEYRRIKRERRVSVVADDDAAERITRAKGVYERAFPPVRTLDINELYVLYQEGILSQDELDAILQARESFAFRGLA